MRAGKLSGIDALGRGVANVRANWQLVVVSGAGSVAIAGLVLAGMVPALALVGLSISEVMSADPFASPAEAYPGLNYDAATLTAGAMATAGLVFVVALLLASVVQCWLQAGTLGALWAGDAQSPPGAGRPAFSFATFSPRFFAAEANRLFGRLLAFYGALLALVIVWLLLVLGLVAAAAATGQGFDGGAAIAIGCGGAIPLLFLIFALALGAAVGQADVPRPDGSALAAVRTGFRVLGGRLGACALLFLLFFTGTFAVAAAEGVTSLLANLVLREVPMARLLSAGILFALQTVAQAALTLGLTAALVALVRAERAAAAPEPAI
ncbi:MAG: hypothetical protein H6511_09745 [Holophagales bacterium]|nr:hypothetical protein [Holophagales bacterium]